jgi:hypothetical protein
VTQARLKRVFGSKMNDSRRAILVLASVLLGACSESAGPRTSLVTRIDHASLDSTGLRVSFTVTNVGTRSEDVPACGGEPSPRVARQEGARWSEIGGGLCLTIYSSAPIALAPGASISAATSLCCIEAGVYRLVISHDVDGSPQAVSAPFSVQ